MVLRSSPRALAAAVAVLVASVFAPLAVGLPAADAAPDGSTTVYDPRPENTWGVDDLDQGSGNFKYFSYVFDFAQIGDTIYSGGKFTTTTNGQQEIAQPYLTAFSEDGDSWRSAFRPTVDWSVFALETSADDSRLFVGGEFTTAGAPNTGGFAVVDPVTGAVDSTFGVTVRRQANPARVHALQRDGDWLYLGGSFTSISGSDGRTWSVSNIARVDARTGVVDGSWRPRATTGAVWEVTPDPARGRVLFGGLFHEVNGETTQGFAIVDDATGALTAYDRSYGVDNFPIASGYIFVNNIEVVGNRLIIGGQDHRTIIATPDLTTLTSYRTNRYQAANGGRGGDTQAVTVHDGVVYIGCHCWGQVLHEQTGDLFDVRSVYAVDLATGAYVESFAPDFSGSSGPWALHIDRDECLWVGTDATQSGQTKARGAVRLCPRANLASRITSVTAGGVPIAGAAGLTDGDIVTNWFGSHQGLTIGPSRQPYIDLELSDPAHIERITLWNRTDANRDRLHDVHVWVSTEPFTSTNFSVLRADPNVSEVRRPGSQAVKRTLPIFVGRSAQYVRVQVDATVTPADVGYLDLTELAIFGRVAESPPVAPKGCQVQVAGSTATITFADAQGEQVVYRSVDGSKLFWRGRAGGTSFTDELRSGVGHTYAVAPVGAGSAAAVTCEPGDVRISGNNQAMTLTSPRQTRERIVLRWTPAASVTVLRDGVEIGADDDGWFTDLTVAPGTTYTYTVRAQGAEATLTVAARP
ncbi:MAG: hypothetical protein AAF467_06140 [Actinomycetota bacterium]